MPASALKSSASLESKNFKHTKLNKSLDGALAAL